MLAARWIPALVLFTTSAACFAHAEVRHDIDLSGRGWNLWFDREAQWKDDTLYFPTPAVAELPVNLPTGGWNALGGVNAMAVSVPGTVEEYLQQKPGPEGDLVGVSWWWRTVTLPAANSPRTVLLRFESIRLRAEVFVNRHLAAYDVVGNSPLEVDISKWVRPGESCEIAVRVTDPAGNFDWRDSSPMHWGKYALPMSHGFGGITGRVRLVVCDPVYVNDIYAQNTPTPTEANALITVRNGTTVAVHRDVAVQVTERANPTVVAFETVLHDVTLPPGDTVVPVKLSVPTAKLWDVDHPNLYVCNVALREGAEIADADAQVFGFRWFGLDGIGKDAVLRLNGRRIVVRTAISWGFWPINGIFPTAELAEKQVRVAKELGLNMLNFHRAIGNPLVLEQADAFGLLYFEEPGAHKSADRDAFAQKIAREKLLRMVRRDRSHPSLVIYNLINEWDSRNPNPDPKEIARHRDDMAAAHAIDPSRLIVHTSAWARGKDIADPAKLHFRPFDAKAYENGWYDVHHAGGPATWNEGLYQTPTDFYGLTDNTREVVYWGEEGAISTPPRLELIQRALEAAPRLGWDGALYLEWYKAFQSFLDRKQLRPAFPDVDAFTRAMGAVSFGHQGRRIENMRMSNVGDGYAINGWEAEIIENHSGIVDCFRNPKADPAILAYYNQPLYVAVKVRNTVLQPPGAVIADFFIVNEREVHGPHQLDIVVRDGSGRELARAQKPVNVTGGEVYGELLVSGVALPIPAEARGLVTVGAKLVDASGLAQATGHDQALVVDWRGDAIAGNGAVWESEDHLRRFLTTEKHVAAPTFSRALPRLDWIAVARGPKEGEPTPVPPSALTHGAGQSAHSEPGLQVTFFSDTAMTHAVHSRTDPRISYAVDDGAAPDPALGVMTNYGVVWAGSVVPPNDGVYTFVLRSTGSARLLVNGEAIVASNSQKGAQAGRGGIALHRDQPVSIRLELRQGRGAAECSLGWITPDTDPAIAPAILERVRNGTTLVILDRADAWMPLLSGEANPGVTYTGAFAVGKTWLGGIHFVREHPLFAGLPVDAAMDWPYQAVVRNGDERLGLHVEGEELAAGCYHSYPMQLGTVVGVIPFGKGRVLFSTLDICPNLDASEGPAVVARKLLENFLNYASRPR